MGRVWRRPVPRSMRHGVGFCLWTRLIALFLVQQEKILAERQLKSYGCNGGWWSRYIFWVWKRNGQVSWCHLSLRSRIYRKFVFLDYSTDELQQIFYVKASEIGFTINKVDIKRLLEEKKVRCATSQHECTIDENPGSGVAQRSQQQATSWCFSIPERDRWEVWRKNAILATAGRAFHKLLEIFQKVSRNFPEKLLKIWSNNQKLILVWC